MSEHIENLTDEQFDETVKNSALPLLVDFWAPWCGPCRMVGPILEEVAKDYAGRVRVAKVNVDEQPNAAAKMGVQSIPTIVLFKNGQVVETAIGGKPKSFFVAWLDQALGDQLA